MPLTNAERQAAHRQRLKDRAEVGDLLLHSMITPRANHNDLPVIFRQEGDRVIGSIHLEVETVSGPTAQADIRGALLWQMVFMATEPMRLTRDAA